MDAQARLLDALREAEQKSLRHKEVLEALQDTNELLSRALKRQREFRPYLILWNLALNAGIVKIKALVLKDPGSPLAHLHVQLACSLLEHTDAFLMFQNDLVRSRLAASSLDMAILRDAAAAVMVACLEMVTMVNSAFATYEEGGAEPVLHTFNVAEAAFSGRSRSELIVELDAACEAAMQANSATCAAAIARIARTVSGVAAMAQAQDGA